MQSELAEALDANVLLLDRLAGGQATVQSAQAEKAPAQEQAAQAYKRARSMQTRLQEENATNLIRKIGSLEGRLQPTQKALTAEREQRARLHAEAEQWAGGEKKAREKAEEKRKVQRVVFVTRQRGEEKAERIKQLSKEVRKLQAQLESRA